MTAVGEARSRQGLAAGEGPGNGTLAVVVLVYLGVSLQLMQVGIIPLLPQIGRATGVSAGSTSWLMTGSLLSGAVLLGVMSRLSDLIGKKAVIVLTLSLVLLGSLIGCFVDSFAGLVVARVLMGAVLPLLALPGAIASDTMAPRRAQLAVGVIHAGTGVGVAAGLLLGALADTGHASWRIFFVVGVIASAAGLVGVLLGVRDSEVRAPGRLDVVGALLLALGLAGVLLAISEGSTWGWGSGRVVAAAVVGVVLLGVWWQQQRRARYPLISVHHLLSPVIRFPYLITFLAAMGIYSALSAITRLAQTPSATGAGYGWSAAQVAWCSVPEVIGSIASVVVIRALVHRGRQLLGLVVGLLLLVVTFAIYLPLVTHAGPTLVAMVTDAAGLTFTLGFTQMIILRSVPKAESGIAVGLSIVLYAVGNSAGSAITGSLFAGHPNAAGVPGVDAYRLTFLVSGVAVLVALGLCVPLARRLRTATP
jgi:MFS family permease